MSEMYKIAYESRMIWSSEMTGTEEFRNMLDEHGVAWTDMSTDDYLSTVYDGAYGMRFVVIETRNIDTLYGKLFVNNKFFTPSEALIATVTHGK